MYVVIQQIHKNNGKSLQSTNDSERCSVNLSPQFKTAITNKIIISSYECNTICYFTKISSRKQLSVILKMFTKKCLFLLYN